MKKLIYMMAFLAMASQITNCKKEDKDDDDDDTPAANVLCDGKGGSSWMRLDSANSWTYTWSLDGQNFPISPKLVVGETTEHDSMTYRLLVDSDNNMLSYDYELREDATTHDLYQYYFSGEEFLVVPGSPTLNQSWTTVTNWTRKVTSVSASVSSHDCNYTGLLEITEYDANMEIKNKYYYKKGLGLVKWTRPSQIGEEAFVLSAVSLK